MPRRSARLRIPWHAFALKEYFWGGEASKIADKCDALSTLGHSPKLSIENSPRKAPSSSQVTEASACRPSVFRHRNRGYFRADNFEGFLEDCSEVSPFVRAKGSGDVFPHHPSWADVFFSSSLGIGVSHLLYHTDLFHKKPGAFTGQPRPVPRNGEVLARAAADDDIDGRDSGAVYFGDVTQMFHRVSPFQSAFQGQRWCNPA